MFSAPGSFLQNADVLFSKPRISTHYCQSRYAALNDAWSNVYDFRVDDSSASFSSSLRQTVRSLTPSVLNGSIIYLYRLKGSYLSRIFTHFLCAWIFEFSLYRLLDRLEIYELWVTYILCVLYARYTYCCCVEQKWDIKTAKNNVQ